MNGPRAAALIVLAVFGPLTVWTAGTFASAAESEEAYAASVRIAAAAMWAGLGAVTVVVAPVIAERGARHAFATAVPSLVLMILPFLTVAWLTGATSTAGLVRGTMALCAWVALAVCAALAVRHIAPRAFAIASAVWQLGMLALLAVTWRAWIEWIGA